MLYKRSINPANKAKKLSILELVLSIVTSPLKANILPQPATYTYTVIHFQSNSNS